MYNNVIVITDNVLEELQPLIRHVNWQDRSEMDQNFS